MVTTSDYVEFVLRRADGTLFATTRVKDGDAIAGYFYDERGQLEQVTTSYTPEKVGRFRTTQSRTTPKASRRTTATCGSNAQNPQVWSWTPIGSFQWYFNLSSTPAGMSVATTETYLRNAHAQWYNNDNYCGIADQSSFAMSYAGDGGGLGFGDNGKNTVGFGSMTGVGCDPTDIACTRNEVSQYGLMKRLTLV